MDSDPQDILPEFKAASVQEQEKRTDKGMSFVFLNREGRTNQGMNKKRFSHFFGRQTLERLVNHERFKRSRKMAF